MKSHLIILLFLFLSVMGMSAQNKIFTANGVSFTMVFVQGGTFTMSSPVHNVTLDSYMIGQTEVTQALWVAVMGDNPSYFKGDNHPVEKVSWDDCQIFLRKLNSLTGQNFRLPTEAEWEFAARGGVNSRGYKYAGKNSLENVAWYDANACDGVGRNSSDFGSHNVGTKQANELGIYDMSGNVWEWCQDWYGDFSKKSQTNPTGPESGYLRVFRGGSWYSHAKYCRWSYRYCGDPFGNGSDVGFRLALSSDLIM